MGLLALLSVLNARKFLVLGATLVSALIALIAGIVIPTEYQSTAVVQVDSRLKNPLTGLFEPRLRVSEFLGHQSAIAGSRTVALKVYDTLSAEGYFIIADFEKEWRRRTGGETIPGNDVRLWAADQLLRKLDVVTNALEGTLAISLEAKTRRALRGLPMPLPMPICRPCSTSANARQRGMQ